MAEKQRFELEFLLNTTKGVLFRELSTPGGLADWFADDVNIEEDLYTFVWEGSEEKARLLGKKDEEYIRFHWEEDEEETSYFQFRIEVDPVTNEVALIVTDFAEPQEIEESKELWSSQIDELRHVIGA